MAKPVVLGIEKETGAKVNLASEARWLGNYVVGLQGMGKSNLLKQIALQDIANGEGVCVISPHPDVVQDILMRLPKARWNDVVVFDPADECPVGLNIFEWAGPGSGIPLDKIADDVVTKTFEMLWADSWGPRMEEMLANVARIILFCQSLPVEKRPTLAEFARIVGRGERTAYREFLLSYIQKRHKGRAIADLMEYWEWFDDQATRFREEIASSTLNKARPFSANELVAHVVGLSANNLDFRAIMDEGKILLVDLNIDNLGAGNVGLLGSLIVGRVLLAALGRDIESGEPRRFHVIADEFGYFATPAFAELQDQGRKFGVDVLVAHQRRGQLEAETRDATKTARNWVVLAVNPDDAVELSEGFDSTPPEPEVVGEREPLGYASRPWDALRHQAHENSEVVDLVYEIEEWLAVGPYYWLLRPRMRAIASDVAAELEAKGISAEGLGTDRFALPPEVWAFPSENDTKAFVNDLNYLLYVMMARDDKSDEDTESLGDKLVDKLFTWVNVSGRWQTRHSILSITEADHWWDELWQEIWERVDEGRDLSDLGGTLSCVAEIELRRAILADIMRLGRLLKQQPVWVRGGQPEPQYDKPRAYSDVTEEWKNRFAHLPKYEAWCRVEENRQIQEYHVTTVEIKKPLKNGVERAQQIRELSRQTYGVCRDEIEELLAARLDIDDEESDDTPPPSDDDPVTWSD